MSERLTYAKASYLRNADTAGQTMARFGNASLAQINEYGDSLMEATDVNARTYDKWRKIADAMPYIPLEAQLRSLEAFQNSDGKKAFLYLNAKTAITVMDNMISSEVPDDDRDQILFDILQDFLIYISKSSSENRISRQLHKRAKKTIKRFFSEQEAENTASGGKYEYIGDERNNIEIIVSEDEVFEEVFEEMYSIPLEDVLQTLSKREQMILKLRFGLEKEKKHTLEEVGNILGITGERVRQIQDEAIKKLRGPEEL